MAIIRLIHNKCQVFVSFLLKVFIHYCQANLSPSHSILPLCFCLKVKVQFLQLKGFTILI